MARVAPKLKLDYSLAIRYRLRDGSWSDWTNYGQGIFVNIELVQRQIRLFATAYHGREKEVRFEHNGKLCDFSGNVTNQVITLL
jgi:hypothetical protein